MNASRRSKVSPAQSEIESEFFTPRRLKLSHQYSTAASSDSDKENLSEDEMSLIKFATDQFKRKNELSKSKLMTIPEGNEDSHGIQAKIGEEIAVNFSNADILDCKYIPSNINFREKEEEDILKFIGRCLTTRVKDTLFVSGNPGTGKTMTVSHVLKKVVDDLEEYLSGKSELKIKFKPLLEKKMKIKIHKFNAMTYKNALDIFEDMYNALTEKKSCERVTHSNFHSVFDKLKDATLASKQLNIVFIDEIDNLFTRTSGQDALEIFKLPKFNGTSMMIIGVSNTIDLIVKLNNQYKVSEDIKNLVFEPYSFDEVYSILKERVYQTMGKAGDIFQEEALRFCAKKIHSLRGGDVRSVLDVMKKAYVEKLGMISSKKCNLTSKITIDDINLIFGQFYGKKHTELIKSLPQIQQLGLIALYSHGQKKSELGITKEALFTTTNKVLNAVYLPKIEFSDFEEIMEAFVQYKFIEVKTRAGNNKKGTPGKSASKLAINAKNDEVTILLPSEQIQSALEDEDFFSKFFEKQ